MLLCRVLVAPLILSAALEVPRSSVPRQITQSSCSWRRASMPLAPLATIVPIATIAPPALALGTGEGVLDGGGVGITGVAWVDGLYILFLLGICGLLYTTTLDFGDAPKSTAVDQRPAREDAAAPPLSSEEEDGPRF